MSISAEVFGSENHPLIAALREQLAEHHPVAHATTEARAAAVAIVLRPLADDAQILFIKRADYENDPWSGQVAFPGGRHESGDATLLDTAMRETMEEIGVDLRNNSELIGQLDDLHSTTVKLPNVFVRPFVLVAERIDSFKLSSEVAEAFWVPVSYLRAPGTWAVTEVQARGLNLDARACEFKGRIIWGMTERILSQLLSFMV